MNQVITTDQHIAKAFTEWERLYRESPDEFWSEQARLHHFTPETYGEHVMPYFLKILAETDVMAIDDQSAIDFSQVFANAVNSQMQDQPKVIVMASDRNLVDDGRPGKSLAVEALSNFAGGVLASIEADKLEHMRAIVNAAIDTFSTETDFLKLAHSKRLPDGSDATDDDMTERMNQFGNARKRLRDETRFFEERFGRFPDDPVVSTSPIGEPPAPNA